MITSNIKGRGPEAIIQKAVVKYLEERGWYVMRTHGNLYSRGWPDLFACKRRYGSRWIEIKNPKSYHFTPAQIECFPRLTAEGVGVWIMVAATDLEYQKLFKPANWWQYLSVARA